MYINTFLNHGVDIRMSAMAQVTWIRGPSFPTESPAALAAITLASIVIFTQRKTIINKWPSVQFIALHCIAFPSISFHPIIARCTYVYAIPSHPIPYHPLPCMSFHPLSSHSLSNRKTGSVGTENPNVLSYYTYKKIISSFVNEHQLPGIYVCHSIPPHPLPAHYLPSHIAVPCMPFHSLLSHFTLCHPIPLHFTPCNSIPSHWLPIKSKNIIHSVLLHSRRLHSMISNSLPLHSYDVMFQFHPLPFHSMAAIHSPTLHPPSFHSLPYHNSMPFFFTLRHSIPLHSLPFSLISLHGSNPLPYILSSVVLRPSSSFYATPSHCISLRFIQFHSIPSPSTSLYVRLFNSLPFFRSMLFHHKFHLLHSMLIHSLPFHPHAIPFLPISFHIRHSFPSI